MEYLGLADAPAVYDVSGVRVEEISVSFSDNKPMLYGPCPFALSCAVLRSGNRDIAPPATERTVAQLEALAFALAVTSPGSLVPPVGDVRHAAEGARAAQLFLARCLGHPALGESELLRQFLLQTQPPPAIAAAKLPGGDVAFAASTNAALYGSEKNLDVDNAKEWAAEKDRSLGAVRARAEATDRAFGAAAREARELLAAGGVLVDPDALEHRAGLPKLADSIDDLRRRVASCAAAADVVRALRDRLGAARARLETTARSYEAGREHPDALGSLGAKRKQDVEADEARVLELERVVDDAGDRFAGEARVFVAAFPAAFSEVVNAAVDDMMAAAAGVAEALDIAKTEIRVPGGDDCDIPAPPPEARPQGVSTGGDAPSWHTDDAPTQEPPPPAPASAGPSWADGLDDKAEAAAAAPDAPW